MPSASTRSALNPKRLRRSCRLTSANTANTANSTNGRRKTTTLIHLITGGTGAGKTTYARALADEIGGVRYSIDDWMTALFWMDAPEPPDFDWVMERIARVEAQMWANTLQMIALKTPVIFDLGFTTTDHRAKFIDLAKGVNITPNLHWIDIDAEERWRRVQSRNTSRGETFAMDVPRDMFDFMEDRWEAPTDHDAIVITRVTK
ncbi:AAA family ATPase [Litorimonas sp. RW-G-Af-16]|uniref:AAA family ATPase n=1 Tax=Litorimonas sp. RW-G-Af-16 TaxID=3241168 RepID=UPI00390C951C